MGSAQKGIVQFSVNVVLIRFKTQNRCTKPLYQFGSEQTNNIMVTVLPNL
jgi:hypothetical protein